MKIIAINGSPHKNGNTYTALKTVTEQLEKNGIEVEFLHIGNKTIRGCMACNACFKNQNERCVIDDVVNECVQKMKHSDGFLLGSPVHYSGISGTMKSFLDRVFYLANNGIFRHKVGAAVVAVRRSGGVTTFDQLNHYLHYAEMILPTSNYWNVIHGLEADESKQDAEGLQIMRVLGNNMVWLLNLIENGKKNGLIEPSPEDKILTNFVR